MSLFKVASFFLGVPGAPLLPVSAGHAHIDFCQTAEMAAALNPLPDARRRESRARRFRAASQTLKKTARPPKKEMPERFVQELMREPLIWHLRTHQTRAHTHTHTLRWCASVPQLKPSLAETVFPYTHTRQMLFNQNTARQMLTDSLLQLSVFLSDDHISETSFPPRC